MDFVDRVLALQGNSPIQKFSLKCKTGVDSDRVKQWILNVLQRGVPDLDLFIDFVNIYDLPREISVSTTLVELKFRCDYAVDILAGAKGIFLPRLKTLVIEQDRISQYKHEMFLPYFLVLEELQIVNIEWTDLNETVSSASLRKLTIFACGCVDWLNPESISFDIPSLLYLDYNDYVAEDYPKVNLPNLVEARINLLLTEDQRRGSRAPNDDDEDAVFLGNVWKLMSGIKNVQKLCLSYDTLEVLSLRCESMPVFNNLERLRIRSDKERGWQAMPVVLRNCPHLETLILEGLLHHVTDKCGDACDCVALEDKGRSLTSCPVKKLEIQGFRGTTEEMNMIKHFLNYFPGLKEMKIYVAEDSPTLLENPEVSASIMEAMELCNKLSSCNVQLLVS